MFDIPPSSKLKFESAFAGLKAVSVAQIFLQLGNRFVLVQENAATLFLVRRPIVHCIVWLAEMWFRYTWIPYSCVRCKHWVRLNNSRLVILGQNINTTQNTFSEPLSSLEALEAALVSLEVYARHGGLQLAYSC